MTDVMIAPLPEGPEFARQGLNLADSSLGAEVLEVTDEFFAPRERMLSPEPAAFYPDRYDDHGKAEADQGSPVIADFFQAKCEQAGDCDEHDHARGNPRKK